MDTKVEALKALAVKCTSATDVTKVPGGTVVEVLNYIVENFVLTKPASENAEEPAPAE